MFLVRLLEVGFCKSWGRDGFQWIPVFPDKSDGLQAFVIARSYRKCLGVSVACHPCCQTRMSPSRHPKCSLRGEQSNLMQSDRVITSQVHKCGQLYRDNQRIRNQAWGFFTHCKTQGGVTTNHRFQHDFSKEGWDYVFRGCTHGPVSCRDACDHIGNRVSIPENGHRKGCLLCKTVSDWPT